MDVTDTQKIQKDGNGAEQEHDLAGLVGQYKLTTDAGATGAANALTLGGNFVGPGEDGYDSDESCDARAKRDDVRLDIDFDKPTLCHTVSKMTSS